MTLTREQLQRRRDRINERLAEFAEGGGPVFEPATPGIVRLYHDVLEEIRKEEEGEAEVLNVGGGERRQDESQEAANNQNKRLTRSIELGKERAAILQARLTALGNVDPPTAEEAMGDAAEARADIIAAIGPSDPEPERVFMMDAYGNDASLEPDSFDVCPPLRSVDGEVSAGTTSKTTDAATGIADDDWCAEDNPGEHDADDDLLSPGVHEPSVAAQMALTMIRKMVRGQRVEFGLGDPVELSPETVASMQGSEHTLIAPLIPRRPGRPRTLAEADELAAELSAVIEALQAMAVDGEMPAILVWDSDRPEHLPRWQVIQDRHGVVSWRAMARMADLEYGQYRERITERGSGSRRKPGPKPGGAVEDRQQPSLAQLVAHLQQTAMAGVMPRQSVFDDTRPAGWARATSQCTRLEISWVDLAVEAGLKPSRLAEPVTTAT